MNLLKNIRLYLKMKQKLFFDSFEQKPISDIAPILSKKSNLIFQMPSQVPLGGIMGKYQENQ
ncbi:hypothetical protein GX026_04635 [Streptococcus agalactiae]|nr:hypothetical protein V193_04605 [Streptococcus agalactiae 138P]AKU01745.1 hypothetical protein GX026_04635 [Streptococcus agalactiae]